MSFEEISKDVRTLNEEAKNELLIAILSYLEQRYRNNAKVFPEHILELFEVMKEANK